MIILYSVSDCCRFWCIVFKIGLGSWPNIDQAPAPELAIFKSMAPAPAPVKF